MFRLEGGIQARVHGKKRTVPGQRTLPEVLPLDGLSGLQPLGQRPEITRGNLHGFIRSRARIKHALLLDIRFEGPSRMPE